MSLIVNADDFGISSEVNRAISECFEKGYIDRTTVMVNMPAAEEASAISDEKGFKDRVGLHINLTQGKPLTEGIAHNPYFCDENGNFNAAFYSKTILRLHMNKKSMNDMYSEVKAQLDEYVRLGFTLNHIDSHHHVHTNYPVYRVLKRLSREYSFSSVRLSRNLYAGGNSLVRKYKEFYNRGLKKICAETGDLFGSYEDAKNYFADTEEAKKTISSKNVEIMVHPMYLEENILSDSETPFFEEGQFYNSIRV